MILIFIQNFPNLVNSKDNPAAFKNLENLFTKSDNQNMNVINKKTFLPITLILFAISFGMQVYAEAALEKTAEKAAQQRLQLVEYSKSFLGKAYARGGLGPDYYDCSGLVYTVSRESIGLQLPRSSAAMYKFAKPVPDEKREVGDLVFFKTTESGNISHSGIYIGENKFIHSASDGPQTGVIISSLNDRYWKNHYAGTGQILPSGIGINAESAEK